MGPSLLLILERRATAADVQTRPMHISTCTVRSHVRTSLEIGVFLSRLLCIFLMACWMNDQVSTSERQVMFTKVRFFIRALVRMYEARKKQKQKK